MKNLYSVNDYFPKEIRNTVPGEVSMQKKRKMVTVSVADMKISNNINEMLVTYSLGSCIGLSFFDSVVGFGGLVHCMMPLSRENPEQAKINCSMYTDTGVYGLLEAMFKRGAKRKNLIAKVAGAGSPLDVGKSFNIGKRNYIVLRKILWKNDILINAEYVGGSDPKSMFLDIATGKTYIKTNGQFQELR